MRRSTRWRVISIFAVAMLLGAVLAAEQPPTQLLEDFDATWQHNAWQFYNGAEFPGANGSFERGRDAAHTGEFGGKLNFDFTGGGTYVAAIRRLTGAPDIQAVRLWLKDPGKNGVTFRYTDSTGQTLQKTVFLPPHGEWTEATIACAGWDLFWGGAKDGTVHGPPTQIAILAENDGKPQGALLIDDIHFMLGKPESSVWTYVAAKFEPAEGWHAWSDGKGAKSSWNGKKWRYDFTKGDWAAIAPRDFQLPGNPRQISIRFRGHAAGHSARLRFATQSMTIEKDMGASRPVAGEEGLQEFVTAAPPGDGWKWSGDENDGNLHGPLRFAGVFLDCHDKHDAGELELVDIQVDAACAASNLITMEADARENEGRREFVATLRSRTNAPLDVELKWQIVDWSGKTIVNGSKKITLPAGAKACETAVARPAGENKFLEAEFSLSAPYQGVPVAQAYSMAPIAPAADSARQLDPSSPFGMGMYLYRFAGDPGGFDKMERAAQMGAAAGVKWSREEFQWKLIEPSPGKFDWTFYDHVVATARRNGISVYGILAYWSPWTQPYKPQGIEDYCRYVAAVAEHYRDDIQYWEIWNEPNLPDFWKGPKKMYADLLTQAYAAIKKANPNARVLGCSTASIDHGFINLTMKLGAPFDILAIHPYRKQLDDKGFIGALQEVAALVSKPGESPRPVWITEMGWATQAPHDTLAYRITPRRQAELLVRAYVDALASRVPQNISWYDFRCDGDDKFYNEHNFGVVTRDLRPRPAYYAYATMTQLLRNLKVDKPLNLGAGIIAFRFGPADGKGVICLWSVGEDQRAAVPAQKPLLLTSLMGDTEKLTPDKGAVTVDLRSEVPVFLSEE